ncbi:phosphate transporter PHO1-2-like isoform X1 [Zingiber officinale]|uniref:phosphate transporter PHO1-2-like isoform X1 n=2 Tax=Zingiber officinale TaxID=94328 RepID=UPI001C4D28C7|nr:phosphate transporter PHO1-2-like isoform X1 [Zingiber officinale]
MVKFSRELEAQLIPEWKDKFVNYRQLKKHVKKIKLAHLRSSVPSSDDHQHNAASAAGGGCSNDSYGFSLFDPIRSLFSIHGRRRDDPIPADEENLFEMIFVQSREDEVREFLEKLEVELEKVNNFYINTEREFCERGEILSKQLQILLDLKQLYHDHHRLRRRQCHSPTSPPASLSNSTSFSETETEIGSPLGDVAPGRETGVTEEAIIATLERNGVSFLGLGAKAKMKKTGRLRAAATLRIDIPATTPARSISMVWEEMVKSSSSRKEGGDYVNKKKLQRAEKMIREAFVHLYKGVGHLNTYSSLNIEAFRKILKKFEKVSNQRHEAGSFSRKVKRSHFVSSDKVLKLGDEVESIFTKHFASNDRKKAMKFLRPQQPKESHIITFLVGLFTGSFVTLFTVYAILAHLCGIFSSESDYMETVYPIFSVFALISLHIFLYGCNILAWRGCRVNHNFIFEFSPNTALKYRDAFLISASLMTAVVAALVAHLLLRSAGVYSQQHVDTIPGALLLVFTVLLLLPFNVFYRSTRYCFLRVIRNIIFSPLYKVLMVDFFMADQLTSQIPLLRHMELATCYFMVSGFKGQPYETCTRSQQYKLMAYIISFLPYYWRAMQCLRRYMEEGYDMNQLANAGKYISAMVAAAARLKYAVEGTPMWLGIVILTSTGATLYQLFWDMVKDWGLLDLGSSNRFLRDELILKNKSYYYVSMCLNFVLRLAWIESVMRLSLNQVEHRLIDFLLASLEIIRRGHWNFYRLENEQLNNADKFRAVKCVPLPFSEMVSEG